MSTLAVALHLLAHLVHDVLGRLEARGVEVDAQRIADAIGRDLDVRGHARQQLAVRVPRIDDDRVHHDVGLLDAELANLHHRALKAFACEGVDGEDDGIARIDAADVGLEHRCLDFDLREIGGHREELGDGLRRLDGLTDLHLARQDDAVDRRADLRAFELGNRVLNARPRGIEAGEGGLQRHLLAFERELCVDVGLLGLFPRLLRDGLLGVEELLAVVGFLRDIERHRGAIDRRPVVVDRGLCLFQAGLSLVNGVLEGFGIDLGKNLVLFHRIVEIDIDRRDLAGDFGADLDLLARLDGA